MKKLDVCRSLAGWANYCGAVLAALALLGAARAVQAAEGGELSPAAVVQIQALMAEKAAFTPVQQKMDSELVFAAKRGRGETIANGALPQLRVEVDTDANGLVLVDLTAKVTPALLGQIQAVGGRVLSSVPKFDAVRARVPVAQLETIAASADVRFMGRAVQAKANTGSVDSQGDMTHRADNARSTFAVDGTGMKVGVISDSVDFLAQAQLIGDLGPVTVLPGQSGVPGSGEGTAMLEIVHDLAPGATLAFATALSPASSPATFAQNILNLRAAGCDIIVDDIFYFNESPFQDAVIAQAVDAVVASGALYFTAAGNEGNLSSTNSGTWEGDFLDGGAATPPVDGKGGSFHSFGGTNYNLITQLGSAVTLFWSDALGLSANDYDLFILDTNGANVVSSSVTPQTGSQDPYEIARPRNRNERVVVIRTGNAAPRFLHIDTIGGNLVVNTTGNISGHAASASAYAVGAVDIHKAYPSPFTGGAANPVETFTSDGPRRVFYNQDTSPVTPGNFLATGGLLRLKPDIAAADGVVTTLPADSGLNPFFGTSAAAPHAAAIAALLRSYNPNLLPAQLHTLITNTALDIMAPGPDRDSGAGIIMAYPLLQAAPPPTLAPVLEIMTNYLSGGNGNGIVDFNECNSLDFVLTNKGLSAATSVQVTLSTTTPGVVIAQRSSFYPNILIASTATNLTQFGLSTTPFFVCGTPISLKLVIKCDQATFTRFFTLNTGVPGPTVRFDSQLPVAFNGGDTNGGDALIVVSNVTSSITHLSAGLNILYPLAADLALQLIGPDGTVINLSRNHGGAGANYGQDCLADANRTTFDDNATNAIATGVAPFLGAFTPDEALVAFAGKSGPAVNGIWRLHVVGATGGMSGVIQCCSLVLSTALCVDGGGQCPGINLSVGIKAGPNPVSVGANLTYLISITNQGPDTATGVGLNQLLPPGVTFVSASSSQGTVTESGGVVSGNLGTMFANGIVAVSVIVRPDVPGTIFSSVSVGSLQPDTDPTDNAAGVSTLVTPPPADLLIAIVGNPNPVGIGSTLTYTLSITNNGPSTPTAVVVSNVLPASVIFQSALASQGTVSVTSNILTGNLGSLAAGANATITVLVTPTIIGPITARATVSSEKSDFVPGNNTAVVVTTVTPSADLNVTMVGTPSSAILNSNVVYSILVSNRGPSTATSVILNDNLPAGLRYVSSASTQGTITRSGNFVTFSLGTLAFGATASASVTATGTNSGTFTNTVTVSASQGDPNALDNTASVATSVHTPFVSILPAGSRLLTESITPANGAIDVGETVTLSLGLQNVGNINNTNLVATLLATGGVTNVISGPQTYGVLTNSAFPVSKSFTFAVGGTNGGTVVLTLQLQDGVNNLGTVSFTYPLPQISTYANPADIIINDHTNASPYPSTISVSGISGLVGKVTVTLTNFQHTFPDDVGVLLTGPNGNVLLMAHCGDLPVTNLSLTFDDTVTAALPQFGQLASGVYKPSQHGAAVSFPGVPPGTGYGTNLAVFNGSNPNGTWSLYVVDVATGDIGRIFGGWTLAISSIIPINQAADLSVAGVSAPNPVMVTGNLTNSFTIGNAGPNSANGVAFTNTLPAGATLVSVNSPGNNYATNAGSLIFNLGTLAKGSNAVVTIVLQPTMAGSLTNSTAVGANETDLNPANNALALVTTVNPTVADLAVSLTAAPNPAVVSQQLTYTVTVTNQGPNTALGVVVSDVLPGVLGFVSATSPAGPCTFLNNTVTCNAGDVAAGATAVVTIVVVPGQGGSITNTATVAVSANTVDSVPGNNSATLVLSAAAPAPHIVISSISLLSESQVPANGSVDPGETVLVSLALANTGSADTANLVATLLPTNGVTNPSGAQSYGALSYGGPAGAQNFSFTAAGVNGGQVVAVLSLTDGAADLGTVSFLFPLTGTNTFRNTNAITIFESGPAGPYPSTIVVAGVTGLVNKATVTLSNLSHTFPGDIDILLVSPSGRRTLLMSDTGGGHSVTNLTLTLDDDAAAGLSQSNQLASGLFKPTDFETGDALPQPAPVGPYAASMAALNGADPNGTWSLYVADDAVGDGGSIAGGWSLSFSSVTPVNGASDLALTMSGPASPVNVGNNFTYKLTVVNNGPAYANAVVVSNTLPPGVSFVGATAGNGFTSQGGTVTLNVGSLAPNAGVNLTVTVNAAAPGSYTNSAKVSAFETDLIPNNNQAQAVAVVAVPSGPVLSAGTVQPDGSFTFTLTGAPLQQYVIQASTDLVLWTPVSTNATAADGTFQYTDNNAGTYQYRYYRATAP